MCVIVHIPIGKTITKTIFERCAKSNRDGYGLMYSVDKELKVEWTLNASEFYSKYLRIHHKHGDKSTIVLHFRLSTSGGDDIPNCHPFFVNDNVAFAHNGVFGTHHGTTTMSDTAIFNEKIVTQLGKSFLTNNTLMKLIANYVGKFNKMVFMNNKGETFFINKSAGIEYQGVWFSASGFAYECTPRDNYHSSSLVYKDCPMCGGRIWNATLEEKKHGLCYKCIRELGLTFTDDWDATKPDELDIICCSNCLSVVDEDTATRIITAEEKIILCLDCTYSESPIKDFLEYDMEWDDETTPDNDKKATFSTDEVYDDALKEHNNRGHSIGEQEEDIPESDLQAEDEKKEENYDVKHPLTIKDWSKLNDREYWEATSNIAEGYFLDGEVYYDGDNIKRIRYGIKKIPKKDEVRKVIKDHSNQGED